MRFTTVISFLTYSDQIGANLSELTKIFERERDWGASLVAQYLAEALHLEDFPSQQRASAD